VVEFIEKEDTLVCIFQGHLVTPQCAAIEDELQAKVREAHGDVVFDLNGVGYVCSSFLRLCIGTAKKRGATHFLVANAQPAVKKVFMISGLESLLG
jgi:anti-anti-sigma factor